MQQAMRPLAERLDRLEETRRQPEPNQAPAQPVQPEQDPFAGLRDDDYLEAGTVKRAWQDWQNRVGGITNALSTVYDMNVSQLENFSRMQNPREWEKYGDELKRIIEQRKTQKVLTADDYAEAIDLIKGRHYQDYVDERAQQLLEAPTTEGVGEASPMTGTNASQHELPEKWQKILADEGMSLRDVEDMVARRRAQGDSITVERWLQMASNDDIVKDGKGRLWSYNLTEKSK